MMGGRALLLLLVSALLVQIRASDPLLYESFDEDFEGRWVVSKKDEYQGVWKRAKSDGHEDYGLLVSEKARKYAIIKELEEPVTLKDGTVVLQFEVRLQNGLECGGAYIKYIRPQEAGWDAKEFDNETPYTIMFGPDKCGSTNKVHFILKHKNPKTGKYVEHHLKFPPSVPYDKLSHVYTAIMKPDNEDAPMEIEDVEATKPEGWLDDEPEEIDDPEASKPEDWDDEEDGEWEAPKIDNPKCEEAPGCGEWKRPMKQNPAYKGKWHAPLIDNPNYKGIWKPQEIPNPEYFELDKPDFDPIAAVGIEIWTMQDGILFDNILIADDEKVATFILEKTWKPKYEVEKEKEKAEEAAAAADGLSEFQKKVFDILYKIADVRFLAPYKTKIIDVIEKGEKQPNITIGILVSVVVVFVTVLFRILFGGKKPAAPVKPVVEAKKPKATETDGAGSSGDKVEKEDDEKEETGDKVEKEEDEKEETAAPRRRSRRET
ncbi:hypothetical protein PVAP13_7KG122636 [Panicum virgatum]|uniref:Calnexin homolog n=1 Tax=Panicum virgatum TaxID=38727 RepID=A0A8T0QLR5_PANVG|nr:hypothetical protein PVAP13_7KG122636 [Panicum virgatum]